MQAEVENKSWCASNQNGNEFRLQTPVTAKFANGRNETLHIGIPDIKHVKAVSRKNLPPVMWRVYSKTSAGDNSETEFLAHALSGRVALKYGLEADTRHCRIEKVEQSDMRDMLSNHLGWKKKNGGFESRFISITSSLLFALQLAVQKNTRIKREERAAKVMAEKAAKRKMEAEKDIEANGEQEESESSDDGLPQTKGTVNVAEGEIYIAILDTSQWPRGTALYKANALVTAYENGKALTQNQDFFIAEPDGLIHLPDSADQLQMSSSGHLGLPEIEGYEQLMWALCQHLKADKGILNEDEPDNILPVGNLVARGKNLRGTKPYLIAPTLKKRVPKIKAEAKVEVKEEIKVENKADDDTLLQAQITTTVFDPPRAEEVSKKRKFPESSNEAEKFEGSWRAPDSLPEPKKPKIPHEPCSDHLHSAASGADEIKPAPLDNDSAQEVLDAVSRESAPTLPSVPESVSAEPDHGSTTREVGITLQTNSEDDLDDASEWNGFESDLDIGEVIVSSKERGQSNSPSEETNVMEHEALASDKEVGGYEQTRKEIDATKDEERLHAEKEGGVANGAPDDREE